MPSINKQISALSKRDEPSRRQALRALKDIGKKDWDDAPPAHINAVVQALQHELREDRNQPWVRHEVAAIFGNMGRRCEAAVPQLIELLDEGLPYRTREVAANALGKIGKKAKAAVTKLIEVLPNSRPEVMVHIVRALADIGCSDQRVRTALVNLWMAPPSASVQVQTAIAMCKLRIEATGLRGFVTRTLVASHDLVLRKAAVDALASCDRNDVDVVPALVTALYDKNEEVRLAAAAGIEQLRLSQEKAVALCAKQLGESAHAEPALRNSGQLAVAPVIEALRSDEQLAREAAARILGSLGEVAAPAVPQLTKALRDRQVPVRLAAAKALWNITKQADPIVPALVDLLKEKLPNSDDGDESQRRFMQTVIEALRRIGPAAKAAIPALAKKAKDKNRYISESALGALNEIAPAGSNGVKH